ncbi:hypothetical protein [Haloplasma contractile]|nr:hypothetical protein [Haloplasma contractile]
MKFFTYIMNYFSIEYEDMDLLDQVQVFRRRNIIVNRVLFMINILVTIFIVANPNQIIEVNALESLSLIAPTIGINILMAYFVSHDKDDLEKQTFGMYIVILSIVYLVLRVYYLHPALYTYVLIYLALVMISLFQNKNAMFLGDIMIFVVASIFHILALDQDSIFQTIIPKEVDPQFAVSIYTLFLLLFIFVITSIVLFSEHMENERKQELTKRNEIEGEFKHVIWNVFDTIEEFSESIVEHEKKGIYKIGLISKKLAGFCGFKEQDSLNLFNYSIIHGVHQDFSTHLGTEQKELLLDDYQQLKYKLNTGNNLIRRIRLSNKCNEMVRSRFESWIISQTFKQLKSEDSTKENQMILLAETYVLLRDKKSYKKALTHVKAVKELTDNFNHFFDDNVLSTFLDHHIEFEIIYENN